LANRWRRTRWRRLQAAVADSIFPKFGSARTMELGRSGRTIDHAAAGARTELRGHRQPRGIDPR